MTHGCQWTCLAWRTIVAWVFVAFTALPTQSTLLAVRPATSCSTLATALELSNEGDTIIVHSAEYPVDNLVIRKPLTLLGDGWPVLRASGDSHILTIAASRVTVRGLVLRGATVNFSRENAAVLIDSAEFCHVTDNRFTENFFGIYLARSSHCSVTDNTIAGSARNLTTAGNGIHMWKCRDITVERNTIVGHRDGIYLEFVTASSMRHNVSRANLRYGLHFMFSDSCDYERNQFVRNGAGVAVMYTDNVTMTENLFSESWGGAAYGLLLKDIRDSRVTRNEFVKNSIGIYMEGSNRIVITGNELIANGWAMKIMANCDNAEVHGNNFVDNSFQIATNSRQTFSRFYENYWSTYRGFDLDRDGFGDLPYRPVSLFSLLVESDPATLVLLRSLLIDVLNLAERVIPSITPNALIDSKPLMRPAT